MFQSHKKASAYSQPYSRLQQQDDIDDDLDYDDWSDLAQHPNSILVTNNHIDDEHSTAILPSSKLPISIPPPHSHLSLGIISNNDKLSKLPQVTRDYINNKWLLTKANKATLANMPPVIVSDIQQGNIPLKSDPTLREIDLRGWTIIHRRLYLVKKQKKKFRKSKKRQQQQLSPSSSSSTSRGHYHQVPTTTVTDDDDSNYSHSDTSLSSLQPSNQLYASVFVKTEYVPRSLSYLPKQNKYKLDPIPVTKEEYSRIVESVRFAINDHIQPIRISQGSSGSYFCRDRENNIVGVFKPKNEEPYGQLNPKWAKWIHRHLFPCCFGRSCLIPNLGYISEAAASLVDRQLGTCIVPTTYLDHFSSPSFHYAYLDRRRYRHAVANNEPYTLPLKIGSFQCFLRGFLDANVFLRDHPWPLDASSMSLMRFGGAAGSAVWGSCLGHSDDNGLNDEDEDNTDHKYLNEHDEIQSPFQDYQHQQQQPNNNNNNNNSTSDYQPIKNHIHAQQQGQGQEQLHQNQIPRELTTNDGYVALNMNNSSDDGAETDDTIQHQSYNNSNNNKNQKSTFQWTPQLQAQFKREFEHLVILDYLIRNTDRGLDNWMIKYCEGGSNLGNLTSNSSLRSNNNSNENTATTNTTCQHGKKSPHIHIAAIDNGLAFPFKHPDEWRSYPYGWLALPNSIVGKPFSEETRRRFLPILSDPIWWHSTVNQLRLLFQIDPDFNERMFQRQMSVLRGQGFNLVRVLKDEHAGPLDLVAMERILVNQEEIFIEYDGKRLEERLSISRQKQQLQQQQSNNSNNNVSEPLSISKMVSSPLSIQHHQLLNTTSPSSSVTSLPTPSKLQQQQDSVLSSPTTSTTNFSIHPTTSTNNNNDQIPQQKSSINSGTRRLRPKRSTSFHTFDSSIFSAPKSSTSSHAKDDHPSFLPWKDKVRKRLSSIKVGKRHRLALRQVVGSDGEMDDDDDDDIHSLDSLDEVNEPARKRVLFVMETIKVVKSKLPYFTCC